MVVFLKIPISEPNLCGNEKKYVIDCLDSTWISSKGKYIEKFEKNFSSYVGTKYASSCSNGTNALHLIMSALGLKKGDEVILPTLTFVSSANSILYNNASPVFVDSDADSWNLDVNKVESLITKKTKAIMAVHLYGNPVDLDPLLEICEKNDLYLIEDTAEALGSEYKGKKAGSIGDISAFSLYGNKTITTGEGGMILSDNEELIEKINIYKDQGKSKDNPYWHEIVGYNYRMTNIQAAIGVAQLENIDFFVRKKREIADYYKKNLTSNKLIHPIENENTKNTYWMYSILLKEESKIKRGVLRDRLLAEGIETRSFFCPMHELPIYLSYSKERYPVAEFLSRRGINLPSSTKLTKSQVEYVCDKINKMI